MSSSKPAFLYQSDTFENLTLIFKKLVCGLLSTLAAQTFALVHFTPKTLHFATTACILPQKLAACPSFKMDVLEGNSFAPSKNKTAMLEFFSKASYYIHIVAGASTLVTGPIAIFYNFRDPRKHRLVGKVFFYAMLIVAVSAIIGYFKHPGVVFFQFLLGISILVLAGIFRGVRSIFLMKGGSVRWFDFAYTAMLGLNGVWMLRQALFQLNGENMAFPILFGVFGLMSLGDTWENWRVFTKPHLLHRFDWMRLHLGTMLGAFTASTTAFTVNSAPFLPWWAQWFGPIILIVPLQVYFARKVKSMRAQARRNTDTGSLAESV